MKTTFIGVLNDKELIRRDSFSEIAAIPYIDIYLKKEFQKELPNNFGSKDYYYKYTILDIQGNKRIIDIGKFKITDISPDSKKAAIVNNRTTYPFGRDIIIHDTSTKQNHIYRSIVSTDAFILKDLLFIIQLLSKTQDWEIFTSLLKIPELESQLQYLKENNKKLKEELKMLKAK